MTDPTLDAVFARFDTGEATAREVADALADVLARRLKTALDEFAEGEKRIAWSDDLVGRLSEEAYRTVKPYIEDVPFEPAPTLVVRGLLNP